MLLTNSDGTPAKERGSTIHEVSNTSLWDRVKQFPGEHLNVKDVPLFCSVCFEPISSTEDGRDKPRPRYQFSYMGCVLACLAHISEDKRSRDSAEPREKDLRTLSAGTALETESSW